MKRLVVPVAFAVGLLLAVGVNLALAVNNQIDSDAATLTFNPASTTSNPGAVVTFKNNSPGIQHNATATGKGADGKSLFRSSTITGAGTTSSVAGTQFLTPGSYPFVCTIHSGMSGTLTVTGVGTPLPRPAVTVKVLSKNLGGKIKVRLTSASSSAATGPILAKLGKTTLTKDATFSVGAGGSTTVKLKLSSTGRKKLAGRSSAKIKVTATPDFGSPATAKKTLK